MTERNEVQTITRNTLAECKEALYNQYGVDYTILRQFEVPGKGFLGLFSKPQVCVKFQVRSRSSQNPYNNQGAGSSSPMFIPGTEGTDFLLKMAQENQRETEEENRLRENREKILASNTSTIMSAQMQKMEAFEEKLDQINNALNRKLSAASEKGETISKIEELLSENDFSFSYINMITDKIRKTFSMDQLEDFELVERTVIDWIGESIEIEKEKHVRPPLVVALVGPTGVGKTTTLVKMVARKKVTASKDNRIFDARLITTDYTRVGAEDQLNHFAFIFKQEVDKAETVDDLKELYDSYRQHCDGIFIDTGGYSPNDSESIGRLRAVLSVPGLTPVIYLAVDAKVKCSDLKNIMNKYGPFDYGSVVVTKCDESQKFGNVISALYESHKKISFITDGQSAAKDLWEADPVYFLKRLTGFKIDENHLNQKFHNSEEM